MKTLSIYLALAILYFIPHAEASDDLNTTLMHWTFKVEGPSFEAGKTTYGTVFFVGHPLTNTPGSYRLTMVTAAHVLENIAGDKATLHLRNKIGEGEYQKFPFEILIRSNSVPQWRKHPDVDVAAMYISLPKQIIDQSAIITYDFLADDARMTEYEIHPGDELLCLGFPNGEDANDMGFPILRSGTIASYPLVPASKIKSFLYDFEVFNGNSGGPAYMSQTARPYGGDAHLGITIRLVAGIVIQQKSSIERKVTPLEVSRSRRRFEVQEDEERLRLAIVVPAHFIRETVDMLLKNE